MTKIIGLLQSRKFWLALIGVLVAGYLMLTGQLLVEQFVDAIVALIAVLVTGIAIEDGAAKINSPGA